MQTTDSLITCHNLSVTVDIRIKVDFWWEYHCRHIHPCWNFIRFFFIQSTTFQWYDEKTSGAFPLLKSSSGMIWQARLLCVSRLLRPRATAFPPKLRHHHSKLFSVTISITAMTRHQTAHVAQLHSLFNFNPLYFYRFHAVDLCDRC